MENLICRCGHKFFISRYRFIIKTSQYIDSSTNKPVECPLCKSIEIKSILREGESNIIIGEFSSADDAKKKEILRKRAKEHSHKNRDQYETIKREWNGIANPKHY